MKWLRLLIHGVESFLAFSLLANVKDTLEDSSFIIVTIKDYAISFAYPYLFEVLIVLLVLSLTNM